MAGLQGYEALLLESLVWILGWTALFYALAATQEKWMKSMPRSTKEHENEKYWCTRNVHGIIHALVVDILAVPAMFVLVFSAPDSVKFASGAELGQCLPDNADKFLHPEYFDYVMWTRMVALAGLAFTCFTLSDLIISSVHGLVTIDYAVHHVAFITCGFIIRSNCMLPFNAGVLMAMEVSTPFLNWMLLVRNRQGYQLQASINGVFFFLTYVVFRIFLNTYATYVFLAHLVPQLLSWHTDTVAAAPGRVPSWQLWVLLVALSAGVAVQFFWFPAILKTFIKGVAAVVSPAPAIEDEYKDLEEPGVRCRLPSGDVS